MTKPFAKSLLAVILAGILAGAPASPVLAQEPAPAPPGAAVGGAGQPPAAGAQPDTPTMSATDLYNSAARDYNSGKLDMASQEFTQYLKWYGNTDQAANAQYYIGQIHYSQRQYETAANDFDTVLERYPDNNPKAADAMYYKGLSLLLVAGRKTDASEEFVNLIKTYPNTEQARQACNQLKDLGKNCPVTAVRPAGKKKTAPKK
jgi:tol-pal system protein YbgF